MNKNILISLSIFLLSSASTFAAECFELGPQAELSVSINAKTHRGQMVAGEEKTRFKATQAEVGGSLASYEFKVNGASYTLTILNETVDEDDGRYRGILTQTDSLERVFMGCKI